MIKFLINRPIAVSMTFLAAMIMGTIAGSYLPVSLMPEVDIPEITVHVSQKNASARELENTIVKPLRRHLLQVAHLSDIQSETRDEKSIIRLTFDFNSDMDLLFIDVNEKVDAAMKYLPKDVEHPKVIKASITDVPIFYLNLTLNPRFTDLHQDTPAETETTRKSLYPIPQKFIELSNFASQIVQKRLEQLPEIAIADISGLVYPEILIIPDYKKMESLQISLDDLENTIKKNNIVLGNILIKDGQYQYNVHFNSILSDKKNIENIYFKVNDLLFQLKDIAEVVEHPQKRKGMISADGVNALSLAIIKQSDARMSDLKSNLNNLVEDLKKDYPDINFTITRDQTKLLDYSISNLTQDLAYGALLSFIVLFLFLRDFKSPFLIGLTIPASLILSLLFFYLGGISINIISLSGLVLGLGMMIDNSIIVIDNITQLRERGLSLDESCIKGANEVFSSMLSSTLTNCAIFIPLIFISGISGALFYDEAVSVIIGAFVSLLISVTIIPVYYRILHLKARDHSKNKWLHSINSLNYEALYEKSFTYIMRHQATAWIIVISIFPVGIYTYSILDKTKLPPIETDEAIINIDWNERINVDENERRTKKLIKQIDSTLSANTCFIGEQQFMLDNRNTMGASETMVYFKCKNATDLPQIKSTIDQYIKQSYPAALFQFSEAENIFNVIFSNKEAPLTAKIIPLEEYNPQRNDQLKGILSTVKSQIPEVQGEQLPWQEHIVLKVDPVKTKLYDISFDAIYQKLKSAFNEKEVFLLTNSQHYTPVVVGGKPQLISEVLSQTYVENKAGNLYGVKELLAEDRDYDLKYIRSGKEGEYLPINIEVSESKGESVMQGIKDILKGNNFFKVDFSGSIFSNNKLIRELSFILIISLLLLYFILASQFESLRLPLIVLIEIPIDILGAFIFLKLFGAGINLMSLIGIVVMCGIIINDSILKIDTISQLRKQGYPLLKAILVGGQRRLKSILMTSITSILAMIPLLLTPGLGSELQKPLALALIGGMLVGTFVSLYFIPLCYYYISKK